MADTSSDSLTGVRRNRACVNCRTLKIKCVRLESDEGKPCQRCLKRKLDCRIETSRRRKLMHQIYSPSGLKSPQGSAVQMHAQIPASHVQSEKFDAFGRLNVPPIQFSANSTAAAAAAAGAGPLVSQAGTAAGMLSGATPAANSNGRQQQQQPQLASKQHDVETGIVSMNQQAAHNGHIQLPTPAAEAANAPMFPAVFSNDAMKRRSSAALGPVRNEIIAFWKKLHESAAQNKIQGTQLNYRPITQPGASVIAQGIISRQSAIKRLEIYNRVFYARFPLVAAPVDVPLEQFIETQPILFHSIMNVASLAIKDPAEVHACVVIHSLAYSAVINEVLVLSTRSLELLLSLLLIIYWYNEFEFYHCHKLHSLMQLAASLAFDLGIGGSLVPPNNEGMPKLTQLLTPQAMANVNSPTCYKAWLAIYVASFNIMSANRRPQCPMWSSYAEEACEFLSRTYSRGDGGGSGEGAEGESLNILTASRICFIEENITKTLFKRDNQPYAPDFADPTVEFVIKKFDNDIEALRDTASVRVYSKILFLGAKAFLHQAVLYSGFNGRYGRTPFTNFSLNFDLNRMTPFGARSLKICFESSVEVISLAREMDNEQLCVTPTPVWGVIIYCASLVLKCRALCTFSRVFAEAFFVSEECIQTVQGLCYKLAAISATFPYANVVVSFSFMLKLFLYHFNGTRHYFMIEYQMQPIYSLIEPSSQFVSPLAVDQNAGIVPTNIMSSELPKNAPLIDQEERKQSDIVDMVADNRADLQLGDDDDALWQFDDDFWKDIIPVGTAGFSFDF